jgi:hypothetical protein
MAAFGYKIGSAVRIRRYIDAVRALEIKVHLMDWRGYLSYS